MYLYLKLYLVGTQVSPSVFLALRFPLCFSFPCTLLVLFSVFGASVLSAPKSILKMYARYC